MHISFLSCLRSAICWHWNSCRPSLMYSQPIRKYHPSLANMWIFFPFKWSCGFAAFNLLLCTFRHHCIYYWCRHPVKYRLYLCPWTGCIIISVFPIDDGFQWASCSISFASVLVSSCPVLSQAVVSNKIAVMFQGRLCLCRNIHTYFLWLFPVSEP